MCVFRDQNLSAAQVVPKGDGPDVAGIYGNHLSAKKHDYSTSALPWPQKGEAITLPISGNAPVYGFPLNDTENGHVWQGINPSDVRSTGAIVMGNTAVTPPRFLAGASGFGDAAGLVNISLGAPNDYDLVPNSSPPYAALADSVGPTINAFRQAIMMQSLLELDARGGTRYVEILRAHFNVISPDFRLQRPKFLS